MPYIKQERRVKYEDALDDLMAVFVTNGAQPGDLNYIITRILSRSYPKLNYVQINEVVGILECAKLEYYRVFAAPYEDEKKALNGSV